MARQKEGKEQMRSLTLMGDGRSLGITLPIQWVRELNLKPKQTVRLTRRGKNIAIKTK